MRCENTHWRAKQAQCVLFDQTVQSEGGSRLALTLLTAAAVDEHRRTVELITNMAAAAATLDWHGPGRHLSERSFLGVPEVEEGRESEE